MRRVGPVLLFLLAAALAGCSSLSAQGGASGTSSGQRSGGFILGSGIHF
jgi:hypothetical protein